MKEPAGATVDATHHGQNTPFEPLGPPPPLAPREVPAELRLRSHSGFVFFGLVWLAFGLGTLIDSIVSVVSGNSVGVGEFVLSLMFVAVASAIIGFALRRTTFRKPIYTHGLPATAVVIECTKSKILANEFVVSWTYTVGHHTFTGRSQARRSVAEYIEVGGSIWVLHDQGDPAKAVEWPVGFSPAKPDSPTHNLLDEQSSTAGVQSLPKPSTPKPAPAPRDARGQLRAGAAATAIELGTSILMTLMSLFFVRVGLVEVLLKSEHIVFTLFGIVFTLFSAAFLRSGISRVWRVLQRTLLRQPLYANGIAIPAVVDEHRISRGKNASQTLTWSYVIEGQRFSGSTTTILISSPHRYRRGDSMWVIVDPSDPSRSAEWPAI